MPLRHSTRVLLPATLLLLWLATSAVLRAQSTATAGSEGPGVEGLWGAEQREGTPVAGVLTLDGRSGGWTAAIAGYKVAAELKGQQVTFALPGGLGSFRGRLDERRTELHGEWVQPGGVIHDAQYATPLDLHAVSAGVWQGQVVPLEQRMSVYLKIEAKDGHLTAVARDPEANFLRGRTYAVTQNGSEVLLEANGKKFRGTYDAQAGTLIVQVVDWLPSFRFTRRTAEDAAGFYPRVPSGSKPWVYSEPIALHDGWTVSTLKREGLDERPIAELIEKIVNADPTSTALDIQSLLIARHGRLMLEEYFYGFSADRVHDMRSAGKTFAPVLVGIARQQGAQIGPGTRVYPLFAADAPFANPDDRKQDVTLRDIMTMTAGNACDDNDDASPGNEDRMQSDAQQPDWYKYTLDLPMRSQPGGEEAVYCSGDLNLVGGVVAAVTKSWLPAYFDEHLARPLQFGRYYLNLMPNGQAYMGGGAYLTPRDQLKLGQLYLDGGVWNGNRVVSKAWVADSTSFHAHFAKERSLGQEHEYGYGWHINTLEAGGKRYKVFAAGGNGGQFVMVIPALDMVVGMTGGAYGEFGQWYRWELELLPQFILSAAQGPS